MISFKFFIYIFFFSRCGDMILSVDGCSLQGMVHSDAVQLMQSLSGTIRFVVISCPGTLI